jgi:hypothetical protein
MQVNNSYKNMTKTQIKNNMLFDGIKAKEKEKAEKSGKPEKPEPAKKTDSTDGINVQQNAKTTLELSERALAYLETLKEKFGDANFVIVQDIENPGNAPASNKSYNVFMSAELLEKMAADENVAKKYEGIIQDAIDEADELTAQMKEQGLSHLVSKINISIDSDGKISFTAILKESLRDLHGKKVDENHKGFSANSKEGILKYLHEWEKQRKDNPGIWDSLDEAEKAAEADKNECVDFKA